MKLINRQLVPDSALPVYIGFRLFVNRRGQKQVTRTYFAECSSGGKKVVRTLRTESISVAIHRAHALAERLCGAGDRRGDAVGFGPTPRTSQIEIPELARTYLTSVSNQGRKPRTIGSYENVLARFVAWAAANCTRRAATFEEQHFWQWQKSQADEGYDPKTRYDRGIVIKQMFKFGFERKLLPTYALSAAKLKKPGRKEQPYFEPEQVPQLLAGADPDWEGPLFATLAYTGIRIGEAQSLEWTNVHMPAGRPGHVVIVDGGGGDGTTKNSRSRSIPLHPKLRAILERMPCRGRLVFTARPSRKYPDGDGPISERHALMSLKRLCRRCGFANPDAFKLHSFRHTFCAMLARSQVSFQYALEFLGHADSEMLRIYFKRFSDVAQRAIETIDYDVVSDETPGTNADAIPAGPDSAPTVSSPVPYMRIAK